MSRSLAARSLIASFGTLAFAAFVHPASAALSFECPFTALDAGNSPRSLVVADLNNDGRDDLVVANPGSGTISVRLGQGGGAYAPKLDTAAGAAPEGIAVADLDLDGRLDVVVTNRTANVLTVLRGNGDGTFQQAGNWAAGGGPGPLALGDLNADGLPDAVVADIGNSTNYPYYSNNNRISVLLGAGGGSFGPRTEIVTGFSTESVALADFNADSKLDVAVAASGQITLLFGTGTGTFVAQPAIPALTAFRIAAVDLDANGSPDLAVANRSGSVLSVVRNNGNGTFAARVDLEPSQYPGGDVVAADFDGDARLDLAVSEFQGDEIVIFRGTGGGAFVATEEFAGGREPVALAATDVDEDGIVDLVAAARTGGNIALLRGNGDATFGKHHEFAVGFYPTGLVIADLNGDGRPDAASTAGFSPTASLAVLPGSVGGGFGSPQLFPVASSPMDLGIADTNGDGRLDVLSASQYFNTLEILLGNGDGTFEESTYFKVAVAVPGEPCCPPVWPQSFALGDVNGDTNPDAAVVTIYPTYGSYLLLGQGDGTFGWSTNLGTAARALSLADANGDGDLDLFAARATMVTVRLGNGDGTFGTGMDFAVPAGALGITVADFDANGTVDVATAASGRVSLLRGTGNGTFGSTLEFLAGPGTQLQSADLDLDGSLDLVVCNQGANTVTVLRGRGDGTFDPKLDFGTGSQPGTMRIADIDVDGRPDLVTVNYTGGTVSWLRNVDRPTDVTLGPQFLTRLQSSFPNPARGSVSIQFVLGRPSQATVVVHDVAGRLVRRVLEAGLPAGPHIVRWNGDADNGRRVAAGVYFCELRAGSVRQTRRVVLID